MKIFKLIKDSFMGKLLFTIVGLVFVWIIMMLDPSLEEVYIGF